MFAKLLAMLSPALVVFCLAGWGWGLARLIPGLGDHSREGLFHHALLGMFVLSIGVMLANFFVPIGTSPGLLVLATGLALFLINQFFARQFLSIALMLFWTSVWSWILLDHYAFSWDTGGYHMLFMNFLAHEPTPLGLVRVSHPIGSDPGWLVLQSAFRIENLGWTHLSATEIGLRAMALAWVSHAFLHEIETRWRAAAPFLLCALAVLVPYSLQDAYTSTDAAPQLLAFLAWVQFARLIFGQADEARDPILRSLIALIGLALFFKLSSVPLFFLLALLAFEWRRENLLALIKAQAWVIALCGVLLGLWAVRNVFLTGCLVFPAAATCFDFPWAMSHKEVDDYYAIVRDFARVRGPEYIKTAGFDSPENWIPDWLVRFGDAIEFGWIVFFTISVPLVSMLFRGGARLDADKTNKFFIHSLLAAGASLVFWFATAPDLRFGWTYFAMVFACASFQLLRVTLDLGGLPTFRTPPIIPLVLALLALIAALPTRQFDGRTRFEPAPTPTREYNAIGPVFQPYETGQCWQLYPCSGQLDRVKIDRVDARLRFILPERK